MPKGLDNPHWDDQAQFPGADWRARVTAALGAVPAPMSWSRILIGRHGETDYNARDLIQGMCDIPLNETGRAQAHRTAAALRADGVREIVSSDLSRAYETAEIIAGHHGLSVIGRDEGLRERGFGPIEGQDRGQADHWAVDPEGAERFEDFVRRVAASVDRLARPDRLLIAHRGVIEALTAILDAPRPVRFVTNASVILFERDDAGRWSGTPIADA